MMKCNEKNCMKCECFAHALCPCQRDHGIIMAGLSAICLEDLNINRLSKTQRFTDLPTNYCFSRPESFLCERL